MLNQTVYEPLYNDVYSFMDKMAQKGIIEFDDQIKPVARKYIAEKLTEVVSKQSSVSSGLTEIEQEELEFYLKDFGIERELKSEMSNVKSEKFIPNQTAKYETINAEGVKVKKSSMTLFSKDPFGRFRLFSYSDSLFKVNVSPILGFKFGSNDGKSNTHFWSGAYFYGYLGNAIGFSFDYRDNAENGDNIDMKKLFTPVTGITPLSRSPKSVQYSEVHTTLSTDWNWGSFTVGKDFLQWGYGESGQLVLSRKAPSFPFIRLDVKPVKWLQFNYFHGWLSSDVIDSNYVYASSREGYNRILFRTKYFASHTLTITPLKGLDVSFGESIIYSDRLEISYLMPLMFFRLADHYLSRQNNNAGGNSQFFLQVSSRNHLKNTHLYGSMIIDEIRTSGIFNPKTQRYQLGYMLGGSVADLPVDNLTLTLEYTKIYPFTYEHYIPTQTYENASYNLGDWIGSNADLFYGSIKYKFIRGLQLKLWGQYARKGSRGTADQQQELPQPPFLFGVRNNYSYYGAEIKYEITHELFAKAEFQHTKTTLQQIDKSFLDNSKNEFYISVYYGL